MGDTENTAVATTTLPLKALQPNDYNPNQMADERFAELVEEVRHLGRLPKPVVARPNGDGQYVIVDESRPTTSRPGVKPTSATSTASTIPSCSGACSAR